MTSPVLEQLQFLQAFAQRVNPFSDLKLEHVFTPEDVQARHQRIEEWKRDKERFEKLTGHARFRPGALNQWSQENAREITRQLTEPEQAELAVWAAGNYQTRLLEVLLKTNPELHGHTDSQGDTPFHAACWAQNNDGIRWLLTHDHPTPTRARKDAHGRTPLECLLLSRQPEHPRRWPRRYQEGNVRECLRTVFEVAPHLLEQRLKGGNTLLHIAAGSRRPRLVCQDLVEYGLTWNQPNTSGFTPGDVLEVNRHYQPDPAHPKQERDARFVAESLEAGRQPLPKLGLLARVLFGMGRR